MRNAHQRNIIKSGRQVRKEMIGVSPRAYGFTDNRLCLTPTLFDGDFVRRAAAILVPGKNPERFIRKILGDSCGQLHYPKRNTYTKFVKDIGRSWLDSSGYAKNLKNNWTTWIGK